MSGSIAALVRYRHFIASSVRAEFANRFARSRLGAIWMVLNPLAQSAVIAFALSGLLASRLPGLNHEAGYAFYLMAGTLAWSVFQDTVLRCLTLFTDNAQLLKKLMFPRICLPAVVCGITGVSSLLLFLATLGVFTVLGRFPGWGAAWVPVVLGVSLMLGLGLGLLLGVLNVFMRDIGQVVPIALQFLFWLTPIVYLASALPDGAQEIMAFNPLQVLVTALHDLLVFERGPDWWAVGLVALLALALLFLSGFVFRRAQAEMVDQL